MYETYKGTSLAQVVAAVADSAPVRPNEDQEQFCGQLDLKLGLSSTLLGRRARFDLYRNEVVKSRDLKDFEQVGPSPPLPCLHLPSPQPSPLTQLLYYKKRLVKVEASHPAHTTLTLLKRR